MNTDGTKDATEDATDPLRPHDVKPTGGLVEFMSQEWDSASPHFSPGAHPAVEHFRRRREALSSAFEGRSLIVPSGGLKVRSNDTDYRFRPGSDFFWLCGHAEPGGVLLFKATAEGHATTLYAEPRADQSTRAFFTDARNGELWIGPRRGLDETASHLGIDCAPLGSLGDDVAALIAAGTVLTMRGVDDGVDAMAEPADADGEAALAATLSELRMVKDEYEVRMLEAAVNSTVRAFEDVVHALPEAQELGERVIEGVFHLRARVEGNDVGYNTIAASGAHATVLHWLRNDGEVRPGDLLLIDAGVECNELYTADVTRTIPVNGRFTPQQRELYDLVLQAQRAGIAAVRPGAEFIAPHRAAMRVIVEGLCAMGILSGSPDTLLDPAGPQLYRRYTLHGTSHMLGLDVHDCSHARNAEYRGSLLRPGNVLTVEPGLYFQSNDLTVPKHVRGIGIRIEDDVVVTGSGRRVLSEALPTDADAIETWMAQLSQDPGFRRRL